MDNHSTTTNGVCPIEGHSHVVFEDRPQHCADLRRVLGSADLTLFLRQLHFLLNTPRSGLNRDGHHWIWRSHEQWAETFGWTERQSRRNVAKAREKGLIETRRLQDHRQLYRLDYWALLGEFRAKQVNVPEWFPRTLPDQYGDLVSIDLFTYQGVVEAIENAEEFPTDRKGAVGATESGQWILAERTSKTTDVALASFGTPSVSKVEEPKPPSGTTALAANEAAENDHIARTDDFMQRLAHLYVARFGDVDLKDDAWMPTERLVSKWARQHPDHSIDPSWADEIFEKIGQGHKTAPIGLVYKLVRDSQRLYGDQWRESPPIQAAPRMAGRY